MGIEHPPPGPAGQVTIVRRQGPADPHVWRHRAIRIVAGMALIALSAWWFGAIAVNAVVILGAGVYAFLPSTQTRMHNAVDAGRRNAWVSPPVRVDDEPNPTGLMLIDEEGIELVQGERLSSALLIRDFGWNEVDRITLDGPAGRPTRMTIESPASATAVSATFPRSLLDRLAAFGATIPDPVPPSDRPSASGGNRG